MRVVLSHVTAWPHVRRGGERHLHELGAALVAAGHDVTIVSTADRAARATVLGVPTRYLRRRKGPSRYGPLGPEVAFGMEIGLRLATRRIDVWHAFGTADAASSATLSRIRGSLGSAYTELGIPDGPYRRSRPDHQLHRRVVADVGSYMCYSRSAGARLAEDFGRHADVVPGGVDTTRFEPGPVRSIVPALLFSGDASEPRKNLSLLVDAFAIVARRRPCELWIAGPGDQRAAVDSLPADLANAVRCLGVIDDAALIDRYQSAWATVLPSTLEAFGMVLVESLACGTPIVALDEWGPAEIVAPAVGTTAAADPDALADACERAIELAGDRATTDACRAESARYDWRKAIVPQVEEIYARISTP